MKILKKILLILLCVMITFGLGACAKDETTLSGKSPQQAEQPSEEGQIEKTGPEYDSSGFVMVADVVPDVIQEIRYYTTYNFVGERIDGYDAPVALMTKEAAQALKDASDKFREDGYSIVIYDTYRPQEAVSHFERWAKDLDDTKMKKYFYPEKDKSVLFKEGYIASKSGHSRGSTIDMSLVNMTTGEEIDVGSHFDYFGEISHHNSDKVTKTQYHNRQYIKRIMEASGFNSYAEEWWHYTLANEPYPDTYFDFPVEIL